jgi:hypothetical protein
MPVMLSLVVFFVIVFSVALLFTAAGFLLFRKAFPKTTDPFSFQAAAGYFLGSAAFLTLWRCLSLSVGKADVALYLSVVAFLLLGGLCLAKTDFIQESFRVIRQHWKIILATSLCLPLLVLVYWVSGEPDPVRHWYHLGSCHGPRYANIAVQVFKENRIPIYGQDYEQSLLASIPSFFRGGHPLLGLYVWLVFSIAAMMSLTYGFFRTFQLSQRGSLGAMLLLLGGNTALSLILVQVVDNGFPILLSGKVDLVRSAGSFFVFLSWLRVIHLKENHSSHWGRLLLAVLTMSWALCGIQNIFLAAVLIVSAASVHLFQRRALLPELLVGLLTLGLSATLISQKGGMLTGFNHRDTKEVPGVINFVKFPAKRELLVDPTVPFSALGEFWESHLPKPKPFTLSQLKTFSISQIEEILFAIELNLWAGLKTMFFPLLGMALMGLFLASGDRPFLFRELWMVTLVVFLAALPINTLFDVNWYRWGLTRFMIPGYTLGTVCLVLSAVHLFARVTLKTRRLAWAMLAFFLLIGPLIGFITAARSNLRNAHLFLERVEFLSDSSTYVP